MKLLVVAAVNNYHFIDPVLSFLEEFYQIEIAKGVWGKDIGDLEVSESDVVWLEWMDMECLFILDAYRGSRKKFIVRCHRYELFNDQRRTSIQKLVDAESISKLLFVSPYVRDIGIKFFPWMAKKAVVLPNLIDISRFPFTKDKPKTKDILFLGRMSYVKNIPQMLQFFYELYRRDSDFHLHIVGDFPDEEVFYCLDNFIKKVSLAPKISLYGRLTGDPLAEMLAKCSYVCCESIFESQGVGILEAMACGLKPVVFSFPGAENFFPSKYLHINLTGFLKSMLEKDFDPIEYRGFVHLNYSTETRGQEYYELIKQEAESK